MSTKKEKDLGRAIEGSFGEARNQRNPRDINIDAGDNADWLRTGEGFPWDSKQELFVFLNQSGMSVEDFKQTPVYRLNLEDVPWLQEL